MNKAFALISRHQLQDSNKTAYLMHGRRSQWTSSVNWARTFTSFEEACIVAAKIGGVKVVEVEVTK